MRCVVFALVLSLLFACAPAADVGKDIEPEVAVQPAGPAPADSVQAEPVAAEVAETVSEIAEPEISSVDVYSDLGCDGLLSVEEFAKACGVDVAKIDKTFKFGSKNCYLSIQDSKVRTWTLNVESVKFKSAEDAAAELERRLKVRMAGASDKDIPGARTFEYSVIGRHSVEFAKGANIVTVHGSTDFCSEDKLMEVARIVAGRV